MRNCDGYDNAKTQYNTAQLRAVNVLIEMSDVKSPSPNQLGSDGPADMLTVMGPGDGHVPRNLRIALLLIDMVQPYIQTTLTNSISTYPGGVHNTSLWPGGLRSLSDEQAALPAAASDLMAEPDLDAAADSSSSRRASAAVQDLPPGLCSPQNVSAGFNGPADCSIHRDSYARWQVVKVDATINFADGTASGMPSMPVSVSETNAEASFWTGWDIGGSLNVDSTSALVAAWDARVPPELLFAGQPSDLQNEVGGGGGQVILNPLFTSSLQQLYGLSEREATDFATRLHTLQRFANGEILAESVPAATALRINKNVQNGMTRWGFGAVGQPKTPIIPQQSAAYDPVSPTANAPHLWTKPFETRFSDCFKLQATAMTAIAEAMTNLARGSAPISLLECDDPNVKPSYGRRLSEVDVEEADESSAAGPDQASDMTTGCGEDDEAQSRILSTLLGAARAVSDTSGGSGGGMLPDADGYFQAVVRSFIVIPYAVVDSDFAVQGEVEPADTKPQSHWVNARTNPSWLMENNGYRVKGRNHWTSEPLFYAVETRMKVSTSNGGGGDPAVATPSPSPAVAPVEPSASPSAAPLDPSPSPSSVPLEPSPSSAAVPGDPSPSPSPAPAVDTSASPSAAPSSPSPLPSPVGPMDTANDGSSGSKPGSGFVESLTPTSAFFLFGFITIVTSGAALFVVSSARARFPDGISVSGVVGGMFSRSSSSTTRPRSTAWTAVAENRASSTSSSSTAGGRGRAPASAAAAAGRTQSRSRTGRNAPSGARAQQQSSAAGATQIVIADDDEDELQLDDMPSSSREQHQRGGAAASAAAIHARHGLGSDEADEAETAKLVV